VQGREGLASKAELKAQKKAAESEALTNKKGRAHKKQFKKDRDDFEIPRGFFTALHVPSPMTHSLEGRSRTIVSPRVLFLDGIQPLVCAAR